MVSWIMLEQLKESGRTLDDLTESEWVLCEPKDDWVEWVSRDTVVRLPWRVRSIEVISPVVMAEQFNDIVSAWNEKHAAQLGALDDLALATVTPR